MYPSPPQIIVKKEVLYLGIEVSTSLTNTAKTNFSLVLQNIDDDINRWKHLPASIPARIATIKMYILPCIDFISSVVPLAPPSGYWQKLDSLLRSYIWKGKRPSIKWSVLQYGKRNGGWACPNFKLYHWAFVLRSLNFWMNDDKVYSWKSMEQDLITPIRLEDFLLMGMSTKKCDLYYGPSFSYLLQVFRAVEKFIDFKSIWCRSSPLWNNNHILSGGKPFTNKNWEEKGIRTLQDINGASNILDFSGPCLTL